jgi:hypothetical protein
MDRTGKMVGSIGSPDTNQLAQLALDPAGQRVAVVRTILGNFDVWLVDTSRGIPGIRERPGQNAAHTRRQVDTGAEQDC